MHKDYTSLPQTRLRLLDATIELFARGGYEQFSIRDLAEQVDTVPSNVYTHYQSKDDLLAEMFDYISFTLGQDRAELQPHPSVGDRLKDRVLFQFEHATEVVAILKYYLAYRELFAAQENGILPDKASHHIAEVIEYGIQAQQLPEIARDQVKIIVHLINGFILESYPHLPDQRQQQFLADQITQFVLAALSNDPLQTTCTDRLKAKASNLTKFVGRQARLNQVKTVSTY